MATADPSSDPQEDDWDDYLHGMFKKLKVDPAQLKEKGSTCTSSKKNWRWYNQSVKTPKKNRKSLALRSTRTRLSPYRTALPCHGERPGCENPLIRSSPLTQVVDGQISNSEFKKVWSDFGKVKGRFMYMPSAKVCSCQEKEASCTCDPDTDGTKCSCSRTMPNCRFGSVCKSKLSTFRTLATIVEESGEVSVKDESAVNSATGASKRKESVGKSVPVEDKPVLSGATATRSPGGVPSFTNYRGEAVASNILPKSMFATSLPPRPSIPTARRPISPLAPATRAHPQTNYPVENRVPTRPEYSCSQEARMAEERLTDDTSVDDLAGYFDSIVYIPRKMSAMAEMMYT